MPDQITFWRQQYQSAIQQLNDVRAQLDNPPNRTSSTEHAQQLTHAKQTITHLQQELAAKHDQQSLHEKHRRENLESLNLQLDGVQCDLNITTNLLTTLTTTDKRTKEWKDALNQAKEYLAQSR